MAWNKESGEGFEEILERFARFIEANIQKFDPQKNGIDPDDISQEIKLKLWKVFQDEKNIHNYSSYIRKIVDSTVIDQLRRFRRQSSIISVEKRKRISDHKSQYTMSSWPEKKYTEIIGKAVDTLMESRKKAVRLFLLNMTLEEISIYLHWSKDKTRNLLYRGLADLKKKLREHGIDYEDR
jgi:RNA polymerase sigma factor (sigma-70 family)